MSGGMSSIVISLGAMQLARRIPFEDPQTLLLARGVYVGVQVFLLAAYYYITAVIKQKNDLKKMKYIQPPAALSGEEGKVVETTIRDYDLEEVGKQTKSIYTGVAMIAFLHLYFKINPPLVVQALTGLKSLYDSKLVLLHILGRPAEGDLKRPWKGAPSMFGTPSQDPNTDAAAIAEAEKKEKETADKKEQ
ncbi:PHO88-related membrane protein [Flagelloscypha sp. PMI_526]|nr:PHO88-related membrane protein [Flagelloscypha sp. PMI_526]